MNNTKNKEQKAPSVRDAIKRLTKAHKTNLELAQGLRELGSLSAAQYAEGSAFAFWQAVQILTGKAAQ